MKVSTHISNILRSVSHMEMWYMKRLVCYEQKFLLSPEEEGRLDSLFSLLVNTANKWRALFHAGKY